MCLQNQINPFPATSATGRSSTGWMTGQWFWLRNAYPTFSLENLEQLSQFPILHLMLTGHLFSHSHWSLVKYLHCDEQVQEVAVELLLDEQHHQPFPLLHVRVRPPNHQLQLLEVCFSLTMLIWLLATKNDVHNVLKVVGNCARLLVNDRQRSRGGEIKRGFRSSSSYLVSFPILVFSFITVFLVCGSCPYFSNLSYNFLLFSSSFSLSSLPFPSLLVSSVIILPIFFYHYFLLCLCSSTFSLSLTVSWLCWKQEVTIPARSLSWPASRTNTTRCLQSIWRCGTLESTLPKFPTRQ